MEKTNPDFKLFRIFMSGNKRKEFSKNFHFEMRPGNTHLISIEKEIDGDKYTSAPREIYPSLLRETINKMFNEIREMKLHFDTEKL